MAQSSISSYFITRKRGIEDDLIAQKKKVICLERAQNSSESQESQADSEELGTVAVFPKTVDNYSSNDDEPKKMVRNQKTIRQGITPQRLTRSKKVQMQDVDGIEAPKVVNFWKGGNLSPQKKSKGMPSETITRDNPETKSNDNALKLPGMSTPVKRNAQQIKTVEMTTVTSSNGANLHEVKKKIKGSSRLADLKTSLNKLNSGLDKLQQMEKKRIVNAPVKESTKAADDVAISLKPFKTIELEILSPKKRLMSPMKLKDSPMKNSFMGSPKILSPKRLFSPTKSSPMKLSPVKASAFNRFQTLTEAGTPGLQLPFKYRYLLEIFKAVDTVSAMFFNRKEKITFKKMKPAVQRMVRKNFFEIHLSQIQKLMPDAYKFAQEKTRNFGSTSKMDYYQLVITPNVGSPDDDVKQLTLSPQTLIDRTRKMTNILTDLVFVEHQKFLQTLDNPISMTRGALTRWHPEFDLESVPDILPGNLPQPPNVEKFSCAKDVLSTARNLFNCSTPMERALERFEEKKKEEKPKQAQNQELNEAKTDAIPERGSDETNDERKKKAAAIDYNSSVLKGVPKSLLDKIRAKQAAKALETMTRRPSQEREAAKYSRLPEICRHARNVYVTEKKGVLPLDIVLKKIENSYRGNVTLKEIEELLRMVSKLMPTFISFHEIRNAMYVKLTRDSDLTTVVEKFEKLAEEKSKF